MRSVEFRFYFLPNRAGKKPYLSRFRMTAEEAAARGAIGPGPGEPEIRQIPETDAERASGQSQSAGRDGAQPPPRVAHGSGDANH